MQIGIIDFRRLRAVEITLKSAPDRSKTLIDGLFKQPLSAPYQGEDAHVAPLLRSRLGVPPWGRQTGPRP